MADYVIGDVQGCYDGLMHLLEKIDFQENLDRLWFVGDLVNRGPDSLRTMQFLMRLPHPPLVTLGNHDFHFLARYYLHRAPRMPDDTLDALLASEAIAEIAAWMRQQSLLVYDAALNIVMVHAGIYPAWDLATAQAAAREVETVLRGAQFPALLRAMYGNQPDVWTSSLAGMDRLRFIINAFTRMRFCDAGGALMLDYKGSTVDAPEGYFPWFLMPGRQLSGTGLVFGHWAALEGKCPVPGIYALDTGYLWGGALTALRLQDRERFCVSRAP